MSDSVSTDRDIAVTIEQTSPGDRVALFARAFGLSARESELVGHLARGADTADIARRVFLSEHTVQDHLKSIFAKASAPRGRARLALTLGGETVIGREWAPLHGRPDTLSQSVPAGGT